MSTKIRQKQKRNAKNQSFLIFSSLSWAILLPVFRFFSWMDSSFSGLFHPPLFAQFAYTTTAVAAASPTLSQSENNRKIVRWHRFSGNAEHECTNKTLCRSHRAHNKRQSTRLIKILVTSNIRHTTGRTAASASKCNTRRAAKSSSVHHSRSVPHFIKHTSASSSSLGNGK